MLCNDNKEKFDSAKYIATYKKNTYYQINLKIRKDGKQGLKVNDMKGFAYDSGKSLNEWIIDAIKYYIDHEY